VVRHLKNIPNQFRNSVRGALGMRQDSAFAELHRSLGVRALGLEGFIRQDKADYLHKLVVSNPEIRIVLEIGFNAGHSSYVFLATRPDVQVVSFDLGEHGYVSAAKDFIDKKFPGRHELVLGDSTSILPRFRQSRPEAAFDLAFIDGGHDYAVACADLRNCQPLVVHDGLVVMDDLLWWKSWGIGPMRAWKEACDAGVVSQLELIQDGQRVDSVQKKSITSAWGLGRYNHTGLTEPTNGSPHSELPHDLGD
jgi:predicted O-methyltransferase YrrM